MNIVLGKLGDERHAVYLRLYLRYSIVCYALFLGVDDDQFKSEAHIGNYQ